MDVPTLTRAGDCWKSEQFKICNQFPRATGASSASPQSAAATYELGCSHSGAARLDFGRRPNSVYSQGWPKRAEVHGLRRALRAKRVFLRFAPRASLCECQAEAHPHVYCNTVTLCPVQQPFYFQQVKNVLDWSRWCLGIDLDPWQRWRLRCRVRGRWVARSAGLGPGGCSDGRMLPT